jgi:hypothetical protein
MKIHNITIKKVLIENECLYGDGRWEWVNEEGDIVPEPIKETFGLPYKIALISLFLGLLVYIIF